MISTTVKTLAATAAMTIACKLTLNWIDEDTSRFVRLAAPVAAAVAVYIPASLLLGLNEWRSLLRK